MRLFCRGGIYPSRGVCGSRKLYPSGAAAPPPLQGEARDLGPLCEGLRPQAVGERTYRQAAVYTTVTSVSQSPVTAYLPLPAGIK